MHCRGGVRITEEAACRNVCTDCAWEEWSEWSACNSIGKRTRSRGFTPQQGEGAGCVGATMERKECDLDCHYSEWSEWGTCDRNCSLAAQSWRSRDLVAAKPGGVSCSEFADEHEWEQRLCWSPECDTPCLWAEWQDWQACSKTCGPDARRKRVRDQRTHPNPDVRCDQIEADSQQCNDLPLCSGASLVVDAGGQVRIGTLRKEEAKQVEATTWASETIKSILTAAGFR